MDHMAGDLPSVDLGPLRRIRVMAAALRSPAVAEHHFDAPPAEVWGVASDLAGELPHLLPGLRTFTVEEADGERLRAVAVSALGHRERFEVVLRPGWCLMQSRLLVGAMAAEAEGDGTRFAYLSGYRFRGGSLLGLLRRPGRDARSAAMFARLDRRIARRSLPRPAE